MTGGGHSHRGGAGEPLVLIHGFGETWHVWKPVLPALEAGHDVLAVGLPGHYGCPPFPEGVAPGLDGLLDAVERDLDDAGFATAHIVGNSLGGWLALELAKRGRARSVVAIAPGGGWLEGGRTWRRLARVQRRQHRLARWAGPRAQALVRFRLGRWAALYQVIAHPGRVDPADAAAMVTGFAGCDAFDALLRAPGASAGAVDLDRITVPVRILWPARDRLLRARRHARRFREEIPDVDYLELADAGHVPMYDDPAGVARAILEFTARHAAAPAPA